MYQYNKHRHHRQPRYDNNEYYPGPGFEMEQPGNETEFNYEGNYEMAPGFEIKEENEDEYNPSYESEYGPQSEDESESELEYVTNEQEFENWVHGITRDHRNLHSVMRHPLGQRAIRHFSHIAPGVLHGLGIRRGGWRGANWQRPGSWQRYQHHHRYWGNYGQQPDPDTDTQQPSDSYPGPDGSTAPSTGDQGGNFKNFVLGTLQNLGQQIASGNETLAALKNSMASSAANNFPSIAQPAADASGGAPTQGAPAQPAAGQQELGEITNSESSFSEETEMELASELLSIRNDAELDHFLGDLFKKAVGAVGGLLGGGQGNILKGIIGTVAKKVLPLAGTAAGTFFGGPVGAAIGGQLGQAASGLFEMELEGLSNEDREFEVARAVVRFGGNAARQVADNLTDDPQDDVRRGVIEAATRYAPGLLVEKAHRHHHHHGDHHHGDHHHHHGGHHHHSGTWYRRGDKIIIENI
jgi:hypothetical protein